MKNKIIPCAFLGLLTLPFSTLANSLEHIEVTGENLSQLRSGSAQSLLSEYGIDFSAAGGVSALPVINGMMGDRISVLIDGATITSACANHMNPPLSYLSASQINAASVIAGISPVSMGGDNIAGVISVETINPSFSDSQSLAWQTGYVAATYQSVNALRGVDAGFHLASDVSSVRYSGSFEDASSYNDGHGNKVYDTLYRSQNHALIGAVKNDVQEFALKLSYQKIPFQGFANQYMDMTDNTSFGLTSRYTHLFDKSKLNLIANWHRVEHEMGFFSVEKTGMMPMNTEADDISLKAKWQTTVSQHQRLNLGVEYYEYTLEDWWPAVEGSMMMGPNDYINIHDGLRRRTAAYVESEHNMSANLMLSGGARVERVTSNAGDVQPYNRKPMMGMPNVDAAAADEFNQQVHQRVDTLLDATLLVNYTPSNHHNWQAGIARKNRAPNLYERYSWGRGTMATTMIGWFGDGNGYIGNLELKPETAHTATFSYRYTSDDERFLVSLKPFYTNLDNYIDVVVQSRFYGFNRTDNDKVLRNKLAFTNLDATLYGLEIKGQAQLTDNAAIGTWVASVDAKMNRGKRDDSNEPLYQIMPWQVSLNLTQSFGNFKNMLQLQWTDEKRFTDTRRLENATDSYWLVNLESQYRWNNVNLRLSVTNLFDKNYQLPLGGVSVADVRMGRSDEFAQLNGQGRSINVGLRYQF